MPTVKSTSWRACTFREQFLKLPAFLRHMEWLFWYQDKQTPASIIPDTDPECALVVTVELPGNRERKADWPRRHCQCLSDGEKEAGGQTACAHN